ncbi:MULTISPECIES: XRE family transcriptional regulator [Enterococcus]|nr:MULTISPECIES: S24 family peptidase [Enterococcus]EGP4700519.1 helix-turn-helix domain-containing protein [Enterococcus faecium]EGP4705956.1 helix-turn-helix domain-containing protein [Enterococcus faecium]EGP4833779.1 helix-turn-helix domain-containing protein [Enterococcus faecium]EGP4889259.1 helix-turn-helix domain-containing protein [Enterococcus faecium]EGP4977952.1 helix-turn-helix domain-containing protein [Enterococcus faecium]
MKKNILGSVIKDARKKKKLTQEQLSKLTGYSQNTISNHENGNRSLDEDNIKTYATALDLTPDDLFEALDIKNSLENKMMIIDKKQTKIDNLLDLYSQLEESRQTKVYNFAEQQLEEQNSNVVQFPVQNNHEEVQAYLSAGTGILNYYEADKDIVEVPADAPEHDWIFKIAGISMKPLFDDGDIVYVDEFKQGIDSIQNGRIYVVEVDGEAYIKKVYVYEETKTLRLVSLNKDYKDLLFRFEDSDINFIGRVII